MSVNLALSSLELSLLSLQFTLFGSGSASSGRISELERAMISSRNWHKLHKPSFDNVGKVSRWAMANLTDAEVDELTLRINNQKTVYCLWNCSFAQNAQRFLMKNPDFDYCDPFTSEPSLYKGHLVFFKGDGLNETLKRMAVARGSEIMPKDYDLLSGEISANSFIIKQLTFEIQEDKSRLKVTMDRKYWYKASRYFKIGANKAPRFRQVLNEIHQKNYIPVNYDNPPAGKLWHSYGLPQLCEKLNGEDKVYVQKNEGKIMVAGLTGPTPEFKEWCV